MLSRKLEKQAVAGLKGFVRTCLYVECHCCGKRIEDRPGGTREDVALGGRSITGGASITARKS